MKKILLLLSLLLAGGLSLFLLKAPAPPLPTESPPLPQPSTSQQDPQRVDNLKQQMDALLSQENAAPRTLNIPKTKPASSSHTPDQYSRTLDRIRQQTPNRIKGIEKRKKLPLGIVLNDNVPVYPDARSSKPLFKMNTGDFVKVYDHPLQNKRQRIHPGVDVYLAATSQQIEIAGMQYPDQEGWIHVKDLQIFAPEQALEYTEQTTPMTLGNDHQFSTMAFYERALTNPDPVVHRVVGPRIIALLQHHEDYPSTWKTLYRDGDSKIRSVSLAALRQRGIAQSRHIVEDLITRLSELTQERAAGETEIEVISIINLLKDSQHPRALTALTSLKEGWAQTQSPKIYEAASFEP